jgi:hypothetical protein
MRRPRPALGRSVTAKKKKNIFNKLFDTKNHQDPFSGSVVVCEQTYRHDETYARLYFCLAWTSQNGFLNISMWNTFVTVVYATYVWNNTEHPLPGNSKVLFASGHFVQYWFVWWTVGVAGSNSIIPARPAVLYTIWPICVAMNATVLCSTPRLPQRVMAPSRDVSYIDGLVVLTSTRSVGKGTPCFMDTEIRFPFHPKLSSAHRLL